MNKDAFVTLPQHLKVIDFMKSQKYPCVLSSSDRVLPFQIASSTHCDILGPNIVTSAVSISEAVDRYVAIRVLENKSLDEILDYFRLNPLGRYDTYRELCTTIGPGSLQHLPEINQQTDGILLTHHHGPCNPWELRDFIIRKFNEYSADPGKILKNYRVDYIYSPGAIIHPIINYYFIATGIKGLYKRR